MAFNSLLSLFSDKMNYLTQKQEVIAKNVASANIAGYRPMEIESFDSVLQKKMMATKTSASMQMERTNPKHLSGVSSNGGGAYATSKEKDVYEVKPSGNAVVLEQQLAELGQTNQDYSTITGLYKKMAGLIKTAIGHHG